MSFDWKGFWEDRAKQDDISAMGRGEKTSVADVIKSFAETSRRLALGPGDKVLDVGCSVGAFCMVISPFVRQVIGVDFSPLMINKARENFASSGAVNCSAFVADIRNLPYQDVEFNKINCWSVIQYLNNKEEGLTAVSELFRILKSGGVLLLGGTPNARIKESYIGGIWELNKSQEEKERIAQRNEAVIWYEPSELDSFITDTLGGEVTFCETEAGAWLKQLHFDLVVRKV